MQSRSQSELGVMAVVSAGFLRQAVDVLGRIGPKGRDIPSVTRYSMGHRTICCQIEIGRYALAQTTETQAELGRILVEDRDGHDGIDLSQVHVAVPSAHCVQLRIVSSPEHRLQIGDGRCTPSAIQPQDLCRWSEHRTRPAGLQLVLVAPRSKGFKSSPGVQDCDG